jgi:hypothetical protein
LLARAFNRARALHPFYLTAWVFLPDPSADGHCIAAPRYPATISQVIKCVKQSWMTGINRLRGREGELLQPRFFDRALRTVEEYREKQVARTATRSADRRVCGLRLFYSTAGDGPCHGKDADRKGRKAADHKSGGPRYLLFP